MAMTTVPTKIVLKSTTRMSLNDRFSNITPTVQNIRANMAAEQQVSAANRRLAQQLANRPGLQASPADMYAMQQGRPGNMMGGNRMRGQPRNLNLQQRLGKSNIKNRLSLPSGNQQMRGRGRGRGRGNFQQANQGGNMNSYNNNNTGKPRGRGSFVPRGVRGRGGFRGRGRGGFNRYFQENSGQRGGPRGRRGGGGGRGRGSNPGQMSDRLTGQNTTIVRRGRGGRGARRGGGGRGGRGRGRGGNNAAVSQEALDAQLDTYMAKTKSALDTELDSYMSEFNS